MFLTFSVMIASIIIHVPYILMLTAIGSYIYLTSYFYIRYCTLKCCSISPLSSEQIIRELLILLLKSLDAFSSPFSLRVFIYLIGSVPHVQDLGLYPNFY